MAGEATRGLNTRPILTTILTKNLWSYFSRRMRLRVTECYISLLESKRPKIINMVVGSLLDKVVWIAACRVTGKSLVYPRIICELCRIFSASLARLNEVAQQHYVFSAETTHI
ncbi:hypothetical protein J6590_077299 [Homalodisca vitripennis]|nr:hypothetical protein J6590_077299 [Homalodisca vitripennis]